MRLDHWFSVPFEQTPKPQIVFTWFPLFTTMCLLQGTGKDTNVFLNIRALWYLMKLLQRYCSFKGDMEDQALWTAATSQKRKICGPSWHGRWMWELQGAKGAGSKCLGWFWVGRRNLGCKVPPTALWAFQGWECSALLHSAQKAKKQENDREES